MRFSPTGRSLAGLLALGALATLSAGGTCDGGSVSPSDMAGPRRDLNDPPSDMGPAADGVPGETAVALRAPAPWQSRVPVDSTFELEVMLGDLDQDRFLEGVRIQPHHGSAPLGGAFSWRRLGPAWQLTFIPSAPLDAMQDYVVSFTHPDSGEALLATGVTTGSKPRVTRVVLNGSGWGTEVGFVVSFSEPMDPTTTTGAFAVTADGAATTGMATATAPDQWTFALTGDKTQPLVLSIKKTATAQTGAALEPQAWDSETVDQSGDFYVEFDGVDLTTAPTVESDWSPSVY